MIDAPKNIRQVREIDALHRIYIEDYVVTFTKTLGEKINSDTSDEYRIAVLLGKKSINEHDVETYISGMVLLENYSIEENEVFSNEVWSSIYENIKSYYDNEEIVGWLYIGLGNDMVSDRRFVAIHSNNFTGKNLLFMVYDVSSKEEEFYDYLDGSFVKRKGFYIYYQKNETMHNYMLAMNSQGGKKPETEERVVKDIRNILNNHQKNQDMRRNRHFAYAAGMAIAAVAIIAGSTAIFNSNSDTGLENMSEAVLSENVTNLPDHEQSVLQEGAAGENLAEETVTEKPLAEETLAEETVTEAPATEEVTEQATEEAAEQAAEEVAEQATLPEESAAQNEQSSETEPEFKEQEQSDRQNETKDKEEAVETGSTGAYSFYIVKAGDNLGSIAENIYNSVKYADKIKELNELEDADKIMIGQKLLLPDKE